MGKAIRRTLYLLAALTLAGVALVCALTYHERYGEDPAVADTGETSQDTAVMDTEETGEDPVVAGTEETESQPEPEADTTILITGDVLFGNMFRVNYDRSGITGVVDEALLARMQEADLVLINNEFPFSDRGTPMEEKEFTFRCSPSYAAALDEMGVDLASLANNHTLDYGREALSDTFAALDEAGIRYAGAGESVERAEEVQIIEVNGKRFGFLAVTRVVPVVSWKVEHQTPGLFSCYDDTRLVELVEEAKADCDVLVVYAHWGVEYEAYPEEYQTGIARRCLAAGADVVAGCHTHCLQGVEWMDGKPVFYSLGNFIFGKEIDSSAVLQITVSAEGAVRYQLLPVCARNGVTALADDERAAQILRYLDSISPGASVGEDGTVTE